MFLVLLDHTLSFSAILCLKFDFFLRLLSGDYFIGRVNGLIKSTALNFQLKWLTWNDMIKSSHIVDNWVLFVLFWQFVSNNVHAVTGLVVWSVRKRDFSYVTCYHTVLDDFHVCHKFTDVSYEEHFEVSSIKINLFCMYRFCHSLWISVNFVTKSMLDTLIWWVIFLKNIRSSQALKTKGNLLSMAVYLGVNVDIGYELKKK